MGTNYYWHQNICPCCGRSEVKHIGKSSSGWCFLLHVYPEENINTLNDWMELFKEANSRIEDDYGEIRTPLEMKEIITQRVGIAKYNPEEWYDFHIHNNSETGPNGLVRCRVDNIHCVGHGIGTWDYIVGDFS